MPENENMPDSTTPDATTDSATDSTPETKVEAGAPAPQKAQATQPKNNKGRKGGESEQPEQPEEVTDADGDEPHRGVGLSIPLPYEQTEAEQQGFEPEETAEGFGNDTIIEHK